LPYYEKAVAHIQQQLKTPTFFVFSDDIAWAKENLRIDAPTHFVDAPAQPAHCDMRLISLCRHHIIANSSFSWWGAWLAGNTDKLVVAPQQWFSDSSNDTSDLIPAAWVRM
jgi:hypothetical protein